MRIGHAGFALVAKRSRPTVPLALLVLAAYGADIVQVAIRPLGYENRELSHSIVSVAILATVTAVVYALARRDVRGGWAVWLAYVSHWPADFVTAKKPTWPGGPTVGLNLYDHAVLEIALEIVVLAVCWAIYRRGSSIIPKQLSIS